MDEITISGLKFFAYHGVYAQEEEKGQNFYLSLRLFLSLQQAGISDELEQSVSYEDVCLFLKEEFGRVRYQLIESVAERLSAALFARYERLQELELCVSKPEAPIEADFENVSVMIRRKRHRAYLSYGCNEGDCLGQIKKALELIDADPYCRLLQASEPVISSAYGVTEQADFYNGVLEMETLYEPERLLAFLHEVEAACGLDRSRKQHWGPRLMDLDILFYDDLVLDTQQLQIPHPDMERRDFVLKPLAQLAPYLRHPLTKRTVAEMAAAPMEKHIQQHDDQGS